MTEQFNLVSYFIVIFVVFIIATAAVRRRNPFSPNKKSPDMESSAIWAASTINGSVTRLNEGTVESYPYICYGITSPIVSSVIYELTLPQASSVHLICYTRDRSVIADNWQVDHSMGYMERVDLEGDFPSNFCVYATRNDQIAAREAFDPAIMQYFADFCQNFDFELINNVVTIAIHSDQKQGDDTSALQDAVKLAQMLEKQIYGWPKVDIKPGYSPKKHFLGKDEKRKDRFYFRK